MAKSRGKRNQSVGNMDESDWKYQQQKRSRKEARRMRRKRINDTLRDIRNGFDVSQEEMDELEED